MIKKIGLFFVAAFILSGCQTYSAFEIFKKDDLYERALLQTKNKQIINSLETKAKITATYLNPLYPSTYKDGEHFFVGVYIPDDYDKKESAGLFNKDYKLLMMGAKEDIAPLSISEITKKEQSELYKKMPHTDNWSKYYVVSFPKQADAANLTLLLKTLYGETSLDFPKVW